MSKLEVDQIDPQSGTTLTLGTSGDTVSIPSGVNLAAGAVLTTPVLQGTSSTAGSILFKEDTDNGTNSVTLKGPAATGDVTVTLPAATDTLVGKATTDTLTNKTINSAILATPTISGSSSSAGQISFKEDTDNGTNSVILKGAAATADVTLTLPAVTGDIIPGKFGGSGFTNSLLIGHSTSGSLDQDAGQNTGVGITALDNLSRGDNNTAVGYRSGSNIGLGAGNTSLGSESLFTVTSGVNNTGLGYYTLRGTTGNLNIGVGHNAGQNITSGDGNIIIGTVNAASATGDRQLKIAGNDGSTTTTWISGDSSGNLVTPGTITANGTVLSGGGANTPSFLAYKSSDQGSISANTATKITYTTELYDTDNTFASSRFTPGVVGKYYVFAFIYLASDQDGNNPEILFYKNGGAVSTEFQVPGATKNIPFSSSTIVELDADDYVEVYARTGISSATAYSSGTQMRFGGYKIIT